MNEIGFWMATFINTLKQQLPDSQCVMMQYEKGIAVGVGEPHNVVATLRERDWTAPPRLLAVQLANEVRGNRDLGRTMAPLLVPLQTVKKGVAQAPLNVYMARHMGEDAQFFRFEVAKDLKTPVTLMPEEVTSFSTVVFTKGAPWER